MIYTVKKAEFITSAVKEQQYPETDLPEIVFSGRSNVGKSSLINTLLNRKKLVKTSSTPGRTQLLNFFMVNDEFIFVDFPGYGYAKVPKNIQQKWGQMAGIYLENRPQLVLVIVIIDIRRDPGNQDNFFINWLETHDIPFTIVVTKSDKISKNARGKRIDIISRAINVNRSDLVIFSSHTRAGRDALWSRILNASGMGI